MFEYLINELSNFAKENSLEFSGTFNSYDDWTVRFYSKTHEKEYLATVTPSELTNIEVVNKKLDSIIGYVNRSLLHDIPKKPYGPIAHLRKGLEEIAREHNVAFYTSYPIGIDWVSNILVVRFVDIETDESIISYAINLDNIPDVESADKLIDQIRKLADCDIRDSHVNPSIDEVHAWFCDSLFDEANHYNLVVWISKNVYHHRPDTWVVKFVNRRTGQCKEYRIDNIDDLDTLGKANTLVLDLIDDVCRRMRATR